MDGRGRGDRGGSGGRVPVVAIEAAVAAVLFEVQ